MSNSIRILCVLCFTFFSASVFAEYPAKSLDGLEGAGNCDSIPERAQYYEDRCVAWQYSNDVTLHKTVRELDVHPSKGPQCHIRLQCYECYRDTNDVYVGFLETSEPGTCASSCPSGTERVNNACQLVQ